MMRQRCAFFLKCLYQVQCIYHQKISIVLLNYNNKPRQGVGLECVHVSGDCGAGGCQGGTKRKQTRLQHNVTSRPVASLLSCDSLLDGLLF